MGTTQAFTVGNERSYDQGLSSPDPMHKVGVRPEWDPPYEGGWVWRTAEEALAFLKANPVPWPPGVYELRLPSGWDEDVFPEPDSQDGVHRLRNDALILQKVQGRRLRRRRGLTEIGPMPVAIPEDEVYRLIQKLIRFPRGTICVHAVAADLLAAIERAGGTLDIPLVTAIVDADDETALRLLAERDPVAP